MSIKILLSSLATIIAFFASLAIYEGDYSRDNSFQAFMMTFRKDYRPEQQNFRRYIFLNNQKKVNDHNNREEASFTMQVNQFADLTQQQFKEMYLGLKVSQKSIAYQEEDKLPSIQIDIDWRAENKVTRVKNQGMCASCWAFCVVGALESAYLIKGISQEFSEQQLVDCSNTYGNLGCHGGELEYTYRYIKDKGINSESSYPYVAKDQNCKKTTGPFKMAGFSKAITCTGLYSALQKGPVSVAVDALFWGFYKDGIYDDCGNEVNHGVVVVGATSEYWLVKNSWGAQWGNNGYIKVKRGNTCSICEYPFYPQL